jgi:uncharacterized protein YcbK (DUF882 family)
MKFFFRFILFAVSMGVCDGALAYETGMIKPVQQEKKLNIEKIKSLKEKQENTSEQRKSKFKEKIELRKEKVKETKHLSREELQKEIKNLKPNETEKAKKLLKKIQKSKAQKPKSNSFGSSFR